MPNACWWKFVNRKTHFGDVNADTTDLAKLLLIEFGLIYANDWFLLPFDVPVGTLSQVEKLAVTNVFGERIWIDAVETNQTPSTSSWSMYLPTRTLARWQGLCLAGQKKTNREGRKQFRLGV